MADSQRRVHFVSTGENAPLKYRRISRPSRETSFGRDVVLPTAGAASFAFLAAWATADLLITVLILRWPIYRQAGGAALPAALLISSAFGLAVLSWRLQVWDSALQSAPYDEREYQAVEVLAAPRAPNYRITRMTRQGREEEVPLARQGTVLEHDGRRWSLSGRQLDIIQGWHESGKMSIRRSSNHIGPGFDRLGITSGEDYGALRSILQALGYVDDDNVWTAAGVLWASTAGLPEDGEK